MSLDCNEVFKKRCCFIVNEHWPHLKSGNYEAFVVISLALRSHDQFPGLTLVNATPLPPPPALLWTLFVDTFWEHFFGHFFLDFLVDLFRGHFSLYFLWTLFVGVFVDTFCGRFMWTIFLDTLWELFMDTTGQVLQKSKDNNVFFLLINWRGGGGRNRKKDTLSLRLTTICHIR